MSSRHFGHTGCFSRPSRAAAWRAAAWGRDRDEPGAARGRPQGGRRRPCGPVQGCQSRAPRRRLKSGEETRTHEGMKQLKFEEEELTKGNTNTNSSTTRKRRSGALATIMAPVPVLGQASARRRGVGEVSGAERRSPYADRKLPQRVRADGSEIGEHHWAALHGRCLAAAPG